MITNQITILFLLSGAVLLTTASLIPFILPRLTHLWRNVTPIGRSSFLFATVLLSLYAGTKAPTNGPRSVSRPRNQQASQTAPICPPEVHAPRNYKLRYIRIDPDYSFIAPENTTIYTNWFLRGAASDWCKIPIAQTWQIALLEGCLRKTPRDIDSEVGYDDGKPRLAVPQMSRLWYNTSSTNSIITWENFLLSSNQIVSTQINFGNPFVIRTNNVAYIFGRVYYPTNQPPNEEQFSLLIDKNIIYTNSYCGTITLTLDPSLNAYGKVRLSSHYKGSGRLTFYTDYGQESDTLEKEWDAETFTQYTCTYEYRATSSELDDISIDAKLEGVDYSETGEFCAPRPYIRSSRITAGEITRLTLSGAGSSVNFAPMTDYPLVINASQDPGVHLLVPFNSSWDPTNGFKECTIEARLDTEPADLNTRATWSISSDSPCSGTFFTINNSAYLENPRIGGHYKITAEIDNHWVQGNILLPPAGAEIENFIATDLTKANIIASRIGDVSRLTREQRVLLGFLWFFNLTKRSISYYRGRPDRQPGETFWHYNQVNDTSGFGAVCTLAGVPIRLEKLSNLSAAYLCKKINVPTNEVQSAADLGTHNDASATISWQVGEQLAEQGLENFYPVITNMSRACWSTSDQKLVKLWPLPALAQNYVGWTTNKFDYNFNFASAALLDWENPFDTDSLIGTFDEFIESIKLLFH